MSALNNSGFLGNPALPPTGSAAPVPDGLETQIQELGGRLDALKQAMSHGDPDELQVASLQVATCVQDIVSTMTQSNAPIASKLGRELISANERMRGLRNLQLRMAACLDARLLALLPAEASSTYSPASAAVSRKTGVYTRSFA